MKTINDLIERVTENYEIIPVDHGEFKDYVRENAICARGYGQDVHGVEGTPSYTIYKLRKKDWITINNNTCEAIMDNDGTLYLGSSYSNELDCAKDDGWGKGFSL